MTALRSARVAASLLTLVLASAEAGRAAVAGRVLGEHDRSRLTIFVGEPSKIEGGVQETERPLNAIREEISPEVPESWTFEQLGLSKSDSTYGFGFEHQWKWVTFFTNVTRLQATAREVAPEDFYIGVKEVFFNGQKYTYQQVPIGREYVGDIDLLATNLRLAVTPVTFNPGGSAEFVPWVSFGLYVLAGRFEVDAGPATGTVFFQFPPHEFVVGGKSKGEATAVAPEIGLGGELAFQLTERSRLVVQGNYGFSSLSVSSSDIGVNSEVEKDISLDFRSIDARALVEIPMGERLDFLVGLEYRKADIDALSEAKDRPVEEILALQEKFNKKIKLNIQSAVLSVGLRW